MKLYPLSYIQLHNTIHMQGTNLGDKINAAQRNAKLYLDLECQTVWIHFKNKITGIPVTSIACYDTITCPDYVQEAIALDTVVVAQAPVGPAFVRKAEPSTAQIHVPMPTFDPNDDEAAAKHREMVRAASANSNRNVPQGAQNDHLIQEARMQAMGVKMNTLQSQVSNAQQVGEQAQNGTRGKRKASSHEQMQMQVAQEMKE